MINADKFRYGLLRLGLGLLALGLPLPAVAGCGLAKRAYPEKSYYNLAPLPGEPAGPPRRAGLLLLGDFRASAALQRPGLIYKTGPSEYQSDFYNEFLAPVGRLWREALAVYLEDRGPVSDVALVPGFKLADWMLEAFLLEQYADLTGPRPRAVVGLKVTVTGLKSSRRPILHSKAYRRSLDLADGRPATFVQGLNQIMGDIFQELNRDLRRIDWGGP